MAIAAAASFPSHPPSSVLSLAHPFTRLLACFALGYALLMLLILRLYIILPDRIKRPRRTSTTATSAAAPSASQSPSPSPSPTRALLRGRGRRQSSADSTVRPPPPTTAAAAARQRREQPASTLVVLGSGGHTKEMLTMLKELDPRRYHPAIFVRAASDTRSDGMVKTADSLQPTTSLTVPRSRSVGQPWLTTPFTTLHALGASVWLVFRTRPDLILCNGPGTCLPICLAGYALRFLLGAQRVKVVFVESLCRVRSLSLTGRLLYYLADRFVVQWPGLVDRYPLAEYIGQLC